MRAPGGVLAPLRERNFALLWSGMTVSLIGDGILLVALAWQVYELSNAPAALAVVGLAMTVPHVAFLLLGGVASDRFDRRRVMIASDLVRGLAVGVMGILSVTGHLRLWQIFPLIAVYGAATAFFGPAFDAFVPDVVSRDQLTQANAIEQFVRPGAHGMAGPAHRRAAHRRRRQRRRLPRRRPHLRRLDGLPGKGPAPGCLARRPCRRPPTGGPPHHDHRRRRLR